MLKYNDNKLTIIAIYVKKKYVKGIFQQNMCVSHFTSILALYFCLPCVCQMFSTVHHCRRSKSFHFSGIVGIVFPIVLDVVFCLV